MITNLILIVVVIIILCEFYIIKDEYDSKATLLCIAMLMLLAALVALNNLV